jgi:transposase-like protein
MFKASLTKDQVIAIVEDCLDSYDNYSEVARRHNTYPSTVREVCLRIVYKYYTEEYKEDLHWYCDGLQRPRLTDKEMDLIKNMSKNYSINTICSRLGRSRSTIGRYVRQFRGHTWYVSAETEEKIKRLFLEEKLSRRTITGRVPYSYPTVCRILRGLDNGCQVKTKQRGRFTNNFNGVRR